MSNQTVTRVTSQSWFSRLGGAFKGILVGVVLFFAAFPVLWMNEGRAVRTAKSLKEGAAAVVSVSAGARDPGMEGRLIHFSAQATTTATLADPEFGIRVPGIRLVRNVEMYQWHEQSRSEERTKLGGGTERVTTYTYEKRWSDRHIDSSRFQEPAGRQNPPAMRFTNNEWVADNVTAGVFTLPQALVRRIPAQHDVSVAGTAPLGELEHRQGNTIYLGRDPGNPDIGDIRVQYTVALPQEVSVVGVQQGQSLAPYQAKAGRAILLLQPGTHTAEGMFQSEIQKNVFMTWILRLVGFLVMFIGVRMVFAPLGVLGDVVPLFGRIVRAGTGLISFAIAAPLSLVVIAIAWIFYRPLLGIPLLVLAVAIAVFGLRALKSRRAQVPPPAPAPAT